MEAYQAGRRARRREEYALLRSAPSTRRRHTVSASCSIPAPCIDFSAPSFEIAPSTSTSSNIPSIWYIRLHDIPNVSWNLPVVPNCPHCQAVRFYREPPSFCCSNGKVSLTPLNTPPLLKQLLLGNTELSQSFRTNIRTYNNAFAFTSLGLKYDKDLCRNYKNTYTFRVQGLVYHFINDLLPQGTKKTYLQLYVYDTQNEIKNRLDISEKLRADIVIQLLEILANNPYAKFFRSLRDIPCLLDSRIILRCDPSLDQRTFNLPSVDQVAIIWKDSDPNIHDLPRHIQVYTHSGSSQKVNYYYGCYDPLQYPLLFPYGQPGWHVGIKRNEPTLPQHTIQLRPSSTLNFINPTLATSSSQLLNNEELVLEHQPHHNNSISTREYYCYRLQLRSADPSVLLQSGRLLQQFVTDQYIKVETQRLDFFRTEQRQKLIRTETLQGIVDSIGIDGITDPHKVGQPIVLPSSFIGGPRDMRKRYMDAMTLVQTYGKPDFFLTMTCNPNWIDISSHMLDHELSQNRPDLVARAFRSRLQELKNELIHKHVLGHVAAYSYVIEFQKRGLPHCHWLLIMEKSFKITSSDAYDRFISAELPNQSTSPYLYSLVVRHMMHGPCGTLNPNNVCMQKGKCKNHFPKMFCSMTTHVPNGYPSYMRRNNGHTTNVRKKQLDNRWVVPYCPYLLAKFDCHINLEICSDIKLVKYLYKYIYKGHAQVSYNLSETTSAPKDEITDFQTARWVAAPESCWRLYGFSLYEIHPPVISLQLHLPNYQYTSFKTNRPLTSVIANPLASKTMLTEFFYMNANDPVAKQLKLLYHEYPKYFVWDNSKKKWNYRKRGFAIGRIVSVSPTEGDRYYLKILLKHFRAPDSFECLTNVVGTPCNCFRDAACAFGLLDSDEYLELCLHEASSYQMPHSLRRLFATILVYCNPSNPKSLWEQFKESLIEDLVKKKPSYRNC